jgi:hypothetical protein
VFLGYRANERLACTKTPMFDDGLHGDGAAGDNVYGASINVSNVFMQYYVYAENNNIGQFAPERAEHEFYSLNATYPTINTGDLVINEFMAQNTLTVADANGEFEDWIELHNNTNTTLSLDNLFLTDTNTNLIKWQFPTGTTIAPDGYLIVWADEDGTQEGLHASFKLSASGESVILAYANGTILDSVDYGLQTTDLSYARIPNGTGAFVVTGSTFNYNNQLLSVSETEFKQNLSVFPNPTNGNLNVHNKQYQIETLAIYNLQGQLLYNNSYQNQNQISVDISSFSKGIYMIMINNRQPLKIIKD